MDVYPCGTQVKLKFTDYIGVITGIFIRNESVGYLVSYFEEGKYVEVQFSEYQFDIDDSKPMTIGFKQGVKV